MITLSSMREALGWSASRDPEMVALLDTVVAQWEQETGRPWARQVGHVQECRQSTPYIQTLWLTLTPVEEITSVEYNLQDGGGWVAYESTAYELLSSASLASLSRSPKAVWPRLVRITYTGGYVSAAPSPQTDPPQTATPPDVARALLVQARFMSARFAEAKLDVTSQAFEKGSTTYMRASLHPLFVDAAARHRRKV